MLNANSKAPMLRPQFGDLMCCTVQGLVDLAALRLAANNMGLTANMTRKHPNIPETSPEKTRPSRPRGPRVLLKDEFEGALVRQFRCPGCLCSPFVAFRITDPQNPRMEQGRNFTKRPAGIDHVHHTL